MIKYLFDLIEDDKRKKHITFTSIVN